MDLNRRTAKWRSLVAGRPVTVRIMGWMRTDREALAMECELIAALSPPANSYRNRNYSFALQSYKPDSLVDRRLARVHAYATTHTPAFDDLLKRNLERKAWHARNDG